MTVSNPTCNKKCLRLLATTALVTTLTLGMGACSSKQKYGLSAPTTTASISKTKKSKAKHPKKASKASKEKRGYKIAIAPIGGLSKRLSKTFAASLKQKIRSKKIANKSGTTGHKMTGYFVATPVRGKTKVSYVLDVTDKAGKRIKRIHGSEMVAGHPTDPWKNVSPKVLRKIAGRTATTLSGAISGKTSVRLAKKSRTHSKKLAAVKSPHHTGSLGSTMAVPKMSAIIPPVEGAPGDGKVSLTRAIAKQLSQKGIKIETMPAPGIHSVRGYVSLKSFDAQRDEITIKWLVFNSSGRRLGVVSQKNKIAKGSLNGSWGRIANAAAGAAAKGIRKLLPSKQK